MAKPGLPAVGTWVRTEDGRTGRVSYINRREGNIEIEPDGERDRTFAVLFGTKLYRTGASWSEWVGEMFYARPLLPGAAAALNNYQARIRRTALLGLGARATYPVAAAEHALHFASVQRARPKRQRVGDGNSQHGSLSFESRVTAYS